MAANLIGSQLATVGQPGQVHTSQLNPLGAYAQDDAGNGYIYLQGIGSTVIGSVVTYGLSATSFALTALSVTGARGPVAIATAAVLANQFGWYQVEGLAQALFNGAAVAGAKLYSASTGKCDDAVVAGDQISNAIVAATVGGSGLGAIYMGPGPFMNGLG
jgi:hypothetical protein